LAVDVRAWVAEAIATFALVFFGTISVTVAVTVLQTPSQLTPAGLLLIALTHGLSITLMIYAIGHVSGGHINPAVTIAMLVTRRIGGGNAVGYIIFQLLGASVAAYLHAALLPIGRAVNYGLHQPGAVIGGSESTALLVELILTFFLVFVIFGSAASPKAVPGWAGFAIGMTVAMGHFVGVPLTGASMNPARSFGPALVTGIWQAQWLYWVGPIIGGIIAALIYEYLFIRRRQT
jgi:MIP family channel proteins